jgi:hypothetical protein
MRIGKRFKHFFLMGLVIVGMAGALSVSAPSLIKMTSAQSACDPPSIMFGRWRWCGYFFNRFESSGVEVRLAGVPGSVNNVNDWYNLIWGDYNSGNTQRRTAAAFVVREMIGQPLPTPPCAGCITVPAAQWTEFRNRLNAYASTSENGSVSRGPNGRIAWFVSDYMHCGDYNTYYQDTQHDIAPYIINSTNTPQCNQTGTRYDHIFIYDEAGNVIWRIRRPCMNPLGTIRPLDPAPPPYNLTANITPTTNGSPLTSGSFVEPGDQVSFQFSVGNSLGGTATGVSCQAHANNHAGWRAVPSPAETTGPNPPGVTCRSTFGPGNTVLGTESIAAAANDTSICRSLILSPSTPTGGTASREVCVYVSSRPYFRVYGGDVSAGNPQHNACTTVTRAGIVGWSRDLTNYSGAGTRYAAMAIDAIYDYATNLGNPAGAATTPSGLAFANTGASGHRYGGSFGSLPCMPNYAASPSGATWAGGNVNALTTGTRQATGPISITGNVNPNNRITVFVNGNVTITGTGIRYPGSWNLSTMPLFQLVVNGNIYIDRGVTQLDGIYIAQSTGAANTGIIYTCTNGSTPYTVSSAGTFNNDCNDNTLVVNGAFVAKQVQFMRTRGTVKQSSPGEAIGNTNQAEVFNYNPAVWMVQPPSAPSQGKYDSITSLPPIL